MCALIVTSIMCYWLFSFLFFFLIDLLCVSIRKHIWPEAKIPKHSQNPDCNLNMVLVLN